MTVEEAKTIIERQIKDLELYSINDIVDALKEVKDESEEEYLKLLNSLDKKTLGEVANEMPDFMLEDILEHITSDDISEALSHLESDDATDLLQNIEELDEKKADEVFRALDFEEQQEILFLKDYEQDEVGAYMQTEFLVAKKDEKVNEAIEKFRELKLVEGVKNVLQVFVTDEQGILLAHISVADLLLFDANSYFEDVLKEYPKYEKKTHSILDIENIDEAVKEVQDYDLSVLAVVDASGKLIGRLTYDDIHDLIQESATEQIYNLAGVSGEEDESFARSIKGRSGWLFVNLATSLLSAKVIALFSNTIEQLVALAALMPIVASMGGNTGSQALAVTVRRLALGELSDAKETIIREIGIALVNASIFALIMGAIAYLWFNLPLLSVVIFISMIINLGIAGLVGSAVPLLLKKFKFDPAVGSSVVLTATTDALGFFSFLFLANLILL